MLTRPGAVVTIENTVMGVCRLAVAQVCSGVAMEVGLAMRQPFSVSLAMKLQSRVEKT